MALLRPLLEQTCGSFLSLVTAAVFLVAVSAAAVREIGSLGVALTVTGP